jgi:7-carboxy-7-deazaguanine synthase
MKYRVNEIFASIDGEGTRTGYPVVFLRLHGCNLHCSYCDTRYSCDGSDYTEMAIEEIRKKIASFGLSRVTVTGGEPLIQPDIDLLLVDLTYSGFQVNVETNGSVPLGSHPAAGMYTMDYKCPSSGMESHMHLENLYVLGEQDVLKFVVGSWEDLDKMAQILQKYQPRCSVFVSPVFGEIEPVDLVDYVVNNRLNNVRVQVQLHKIIWDPKKRGV